VKSFSILSLCTLATVGCYVGACNGDPSVNNSAFQAPGAGSSSGQGRADAGPPAEVPTYAIGGTVTGLAGTGLVLQSSAGDDVAIAADGSFTFEKKLATGASYAVTIKTQPSTPAQTCSVSGGSGTIVKGNVTSVTVKCETNRYTVGGTIAGLAGAGLILQNNLGDDFVAAANGTFAFATTATDGDAYAVSVKAQPTDPSQTCAVDDAAGAVGAADVVGVKVVCTTNTFDVGGSVTGLAGTGLVLRNADEDLAVGEGAFTFAHRVASGDAYGVSIVTQPSSPAQTCEVSGGTGTIGGAPVSSIAINCKTDAFALGGSVTGLQGSGLRLKNNGADELPLTANGTFAFDTVIDNDQPYAVTIASQPTLPSQTCSISNGAGVMGTAAVTNLGVVCVTNTYKVKGNITGLAGAGLVLQNDAGNDLPLSANGGFEFTSSVESGATYAVTVKTQPTGPSQSCVVTRGTGAVGAADVEDVSIACTTSSYTVGGTVAGKLGAGLVLQNSAGDDLVITEDGPFTFPTSVQSGSSYLVSIKTQPSNPEQTCTVSAGSGVVTNGNVATVTVNCTTNQYTIGGTASGVAGTGLVLQNDVGDDLTVNGDGTFSFSAPVSSGATYAVTVKTQPTNPGQTCSVSNGSGSVGGANVTNVSVTCVTHRYTVGGTASGEAVAGLVLQNNLGDDLPVTAAGAFTFAGTVASGAAYSVTVRTAPSGFGCTVTNGSGTMGGANVTNVAVLCSPLSCFNNPKWQPVTCTDKSYVWSSDRAVATTVAAANSNRVLYTHNSCSLNGAGWIATAPSTISSCSTNWYHLGGTYSGACGGWDGTFVRRLALGDHDCYDY